MPTQDFKGTVNGITPVDQDSVNWTPTDGSGAGLSLSVNSATVLRVADLIFITCRVTYPSTADGSAAKISGLVHNCPYFCTMQVNSNSAVTDLIARVLNTDVEIMTSANTAVTNAQLSEKLVIFSGCYRRTST
jgi:hypothetical protein